MDLIGDGYKPAGARFDQIYQNSPKSGSNKDLRAEKNPCPSIKSPLLGFRMS